jgi:hypothetical protein
MLSGILFLGACTIVGLPLAWVLFKWADARGYR